jgi:hypothetical protein
VQANQETNFFDMHNQDKNVENNLSRKKMEKSIRNENKKKQLVNYYRCEMGFKATCQQGQGESDQ